MAGSLVGAVAAAAANVRTLVEPGVYRPFGVERLLIVLSGTNHLLNLLCVMFAVALVAVAATRLPLDLTLYAAALALTPAFFGTQENPLTLIIRDRDESACGGSDVDLEAAC